MRDEIGFGHPWALGDAGDSLANALLLRRLRAERPDDAVLSEEAHDDLIAAEVTTGYGSSTRWTAPVSSPRRGATTGRYTSRCGNAPPTARREITDAAVALPARGNMVYRSDTVTADAARVGIPDTFRIAVSATRPPAVLHRIRQTLAIQPVAIGSAGAKAMAVIDGDVDAYVHAGGQWEWDSAAPAGVVMAAGMHASRLDGSPLRYNQLDPYLPDFVMCRAEVAPILLGAIRQAWR